MTTQTVGHTPGPRSMQHRGDLAEYHSLAEGGEVVGVFTGPNARANALLDAAAPDLLAALEAMIEVLRTGNRISDLAVQVYGAKAALAKASA